MPPAGYPGEPIDARHRRGIRREQLNAEGVQYDILPDCKRGLAEFSGLIKVTAIENYSGSCGTTGGNQVCEVGEVPNMRPQEASKRFWFSNYPEVRYAWHFHLDTR